MDAGFWHRAWAEGRTGFHRDSVHPDLVDRGDAWVDGARGVFVPLCGKSHDLPWLADRAPTVGVELSGTAIAQLHAEHDLEPRREERAAGVAWHTQGLTVLQADLFDLTAEDVGPIDRVWDRAALVALRPDQRAPYVARLRDWLLPGGQILLSAFAYDPEVMSGPPHAVPETAVRRLYEGCLIEILDDDRTLPEPWARAGHRWWRRTLYRITV